MKSVKNLIGKNIKVISCNKIEDKLVLNVNGKKKILFTKPGSQLLLEEADKDE